MEHHAAGPEDGVGAGAEDGVDEGAGRGGGGGRAVEPPPPLLPHCDVTHVEKLTQALVMAELRAAHVVALATAVVLKDEQYVDRDTSAVAVAPAAERQTGSLVYEDTPLVAVVHINSIDATWGHHAGAGPEDGVDDGVGRGGGRGGDGGGGTPSTSTSTRLASICAHVANLLRKTAESKAAVLVSMANLATRADW